MTSDTNTVTSKDTWYSCGPLSSKPATSKDTPKGLTPLRGKTKDEYFQTSRIRALRVDMLMQEHRERVVGLLE
jgi:hypothetical protein